MPTLDIDAVVTDPSVYATARPALRERMIAIRRDRRIRLGDSMTVEFENRDTLQYQVQEMVHTERLTARADVSHEADAYARLLPTSHSLVCTVFIDITDEATIKARLAELAGIQHLFTLTVDGTELAGVEVVGEDEEAGATATVSVHAVRFTMSDAQRDAFRDPAVAASVDVGHPAYDDSVPLTGTTRLALISDLTLA